MTTPLAVLGAIFVVVLVTWNPDVWPMIVVFLVGVWLGSRMERKNTARHPEG